MLGGMNRLLAGYVLGWLLLALPLWAGDAPRHGLMWNRTGLPLTFPLVIRTDPGQDYHVLLRHAQDGAPALAAFIEGGRFFRVLAPPGTYRVEISHGTDWQDETRLFGPQTELITLAEPLTFAVRNYATRGGHLIDLRWMQSQEVSLRTRPVKLCQSLVLQPGEDPRAGLREERADKAGEEVLLPPLEPALVYPAPQGRQPLRDSLMRWEVRPRVC